MKTLTHQTRRFASRADIPKTYRGLCELYLPRPIHNDAQDEEATAMMNALVGFPRFNTEQQDYLDVLTGICGRIRQRQENPPAENQRFGVAQIPVGRKRNECGRIVSRILGTSRNLGAMILRGERRLTAGACPHAG